MAAGRAGQRVEQERQRLAGIAGAAETESERMQRLRQMVLRLERDDLARRDDAGRAQFERPVADAAADAERQCEARKLGTAQVGPVRQRRARRGKTRGRS